MLLHPGRFLSSMSHGLRKLETEVVASVANVYDLDTSAAATAEDDVSRIFRSVRSVLTDKQLAELEEKLGKLRSLLTGSLPEPIQASLLTFSAAELEALEEKIRERSCENICIAGYAMKRSTQSASWLPPMSNEWAGVKKARR